MNFKVYRMTHPRLNLWIRRLVGTCDCGTRWNEDCLAALTEEAYPSDGGGWKSVLEHG